MMRRGRTEGEVPLLEDRWPVLEEEREQRAERIRHHLGEIGGATGVVRGPRRIIY